MAMAIAVVVLARPRFHRRRWRSAEVRERKMHEIRERESCALERKREGGESQVERREKKLLKN